MTLIEITNIFIRGAFGLALAGGILAFVWYRVASVRWRPLSEYYGRPIETAREVRRLQTLIIHGVGAAFESYKGIVTVGVSDSGLSLSLLPPWAVFHAPLFIPYGDISIRERQWFLFKAVEITTRKAPQTKIVIYPELWNWIEEQAKANERQDDRYYSSSRLRSFART